MTLCVCVSFANKGDKMRHTNLKIQSYKQMITTTENLWSFGYYKMDLLLAYTENISPQIEKERLEMYVQLQVHRGSLASKW